MDAGFNCKGMEELKHQLESICLQFHTWLEKFLLKQALTALEEIKRATPAGLGGLREDWYIGDIKRKGSAIEISIANDNSFASSAEYGYMNEDRTNWVPGLFICTLTMEEIKRKMPEKFTGEFSKWVLGLGGNVK